MKLPLFLLACFLYQLEAFYFAGVTPKDFTINEKVDLLVNPLTSSGTLIPYDFYYEKFHFCKPEAGIVSQSESLGSVLLGDRLFDSSIQIFVLQNSTCNTWCTSNVSGGDADFINSRIKEMYSFNWVVDGLPGAQIMNVNNSTLYSPGFYLGYDNEDQQYINNHYEIEIQYHPVSADKYRVVGVIVSPYSIERKSGGENICESNAPKILSKDEDNEIVYTYSISWKYSPMPWATRWDVYSSVLTHDIHWFSIVNSCMISLLLSGMISLILLRALHYDIARYNQKQSPSESGLIDEDFGWKLVHADVFRPPKNRMLLSTLVGTGVQLVFLILFSIVIAALGFFSPAKRGILSTAILIVYVLLSGVSGYITTRLYKYYGGEKVKTTIFTVAFGIPGILFAVFVTLNFIFIGQNSSSAAPFGTIAAIFCLWTMISAPLSILGGIVGNATRIPENPCKTNAIPREIPPQPFYLHEIITLWCGGILPFGAAFVELYFIVNSIWFNRIYFVFGFLLMVITIVVIICAEVAVLLCYSQLCTEDYNWQWRSFRTVGFSGFYVFLFGIAFGIRRLEADSVASFFVYVGWTTVLSCAVAIFTGSIGYLASLYFVRKIFSSIKVD